MFGTIFVVFGVLFWFMISGRGGSGGSGAVTVTNSGPSDAQVAAGTQLQMAQLGAQTQIAMGQMALGAKAAEMEATKELAGMELAYRVQELGVTAALNSKTIEASLAALSLNLSTQSSINHDNNQFMLDYASNAQDAATTQLLIGANLQRDLGAQQLDAFKTSSMLSIIPTLKKKDRDESLQIISGNITGNPVSYYNGPGSAQVYG